MVKETRKISSMRERTHEGVDNIMDRAESIGRSGKEKISHLKEKATMVKDNVDGYIQKNPERSVLIAAGVGAVIAATIMRKKHQVVS